MGGERREVWTETGLEWGGGFGWIEKLSGELDWGALLIGTQVGQV